MTRSEQAAPASRPLTVLVAWANDLSENLGVRVLAEGSAALLREAHPSSEITFVSYGVGVSPRRVGLRTLLLAFAGVDRSFLAWLRTFDVMFDTGAGDSFASIYGIRRLLEMSLLRLVAARSGVRLVLGPQTVGPFDSRMSRLLAKWSTRRAELVLARDVRSAEVARQLHIGSEVVETTDVVFSLQVPECEVPHDRVLVNVSGLLWAPNPHVSSSSYRDAMLAIVKDLAERDLEIELFAHVIGHAHHDSDVSATYELRDRLAMVGIELPVVVPESLEDARQRIAGARLLIGARMHACLNALSVGTPAVALAYSRKFAPLLDAVGWRAHASLQRGAADIAATVALFVDDLLGDGATHARASRSAASGLSIDASNAIAKLLG